MATEPLARAIETPPDSPSEHDYQAFCTLLTQSERGRALLGEHARRNRHAETEVLLTAIARLEARLRADASAVQRLRDDLHMLVIAIRLARPEIDAAGPAVQATKLKLLLDLLERRLDAMAGAQAAVPEEHEALRALAPVTPPDEPELPIPSPGSAAPSVAVVASAAMMSEINFPEYELAELDAAPALERRTAAETPTAAILPRPEPLAAIMALSEEERLALFT
jgi:hypothetical protein